MVVSPTSGRIGVAYISGAGQVIDGGPTPDYEVRYVEWMNGGTSTPVVVDAVKRFAGVTIDFHPDSGQPAIAYLGGAADMTSPYWLNSDAVVAFRAGNGWTRETAASTGSQVTCGNPVSDRGGVVGLWPAIRYDSSGRLWFCYRDVHDGQLPQADWAGSDVECVNGSIGAWQRECVKPGGNDKQAWGGHIRMMMVNDQPALGYDQMFGGADTSGQNAIVQQRTGAGWGPAQAVFMIPDVQSGPSPGYDSVAGWGLATLDWNAGALRYSRSSGTASWSSPGDVVVADAGTTGLFPALAFDPVLHQPSIAYSHCSSTPGVLDLANCPAGDRQLRIAEQNGSAWYSEVVAMEGASQVRYAILASGSRVVAYRDLTTGSVKLAVESPAGGDGGIESSCSNGVDDDGDTFVDCIDSDCQGRTCAAGCVCAGGIKVETNCSDNIDNDGDMVTDCADPDCNAASCGSGCECRADGGRREVTCFDAIDNDGDSLTDCADPDCTSHFCTPAPIFFTCTMAGLCRCNGGTQVAEVGALCRDSIDNDCNGKTDCAESACLGQSCNPDGGPGTCNAMMVCQ
jgi:hypothetical protein